MTAVMAVNIVSTGPVIGPGLLWSLGYAKLLGFKLQLLPLRGYSRDLLSLIPEEDVVSINGSPWNYGTPRDVIRRLRMKQVTPEDEPPLPWDWLLFGSTWGPLEKRIRNIREMFPEALLITHRLDEQPPLDGGAFELCPEGLYFGNTSTSAVLRDRETQVVLDYRHLTREDNYGYGIRVTKDPLKLLERVARSRIAGVHFNPPTAQDILDWINGTDTEFVRFYKRLLAIVEAQPRDIPFVVETGPTKLYKLPSLAKSFSTGTAKGREMRMVLRPA